MAIANIANFTSKCDNLQIFLFFVGEICFRCSVFQQNKYFEAIPVNRHGGQCEAAGVHGKVDKEVDDFAHEGTEYPSLQRVDGSLERNAKDDEEEVSHAQVEYEQIGRVVRDLSASQQYSEHQTVANGAEQEYEREDH